MMLSESMKNSRRLAPRILFGYRRKVEIEEKSRKDMGDSGLTKITDISEKKEK
jgi:hypothetical protein